MSKNPEVKLARNTELAFTEAHLTDLKPESCISINHNQSINEISIAHPTKRGRRRFTM